MTAQLADPGAEVIKVEIPAHGDDSRQHHPPGRGGEAAIFLALNRSKNSVVLDLACDEGRAVARRLATEADILVENFRPGAMKKLGLDYDSLRALNPRLLYCTISGYGSAAACSALPGYDPITQAQTGYMYMTGDSSMPPIRAGGQSWIS